MGELVMRSGPIGDDRSKEPVDNGQSLARAGAPAQPQTAGGIGQSRSVPDVAPGRGSPTTHRSSRLGDRIYRAGLASLAAVVLIELFLVTQQVWTLAHPSVSHFGWTFISSSAWDPVRAEFGAFPFIWGTVLTSALALLMALPAGIGMAIFLSEMAPVRVKNLVRFPVEMLAAIPSVVYGLWGLSVVAPLLRDHVEPGLSATGAPFLAGPSLGVGVLAASVVLAVMVLPTVASISLEVLAAVPRSQREGFFALGATRWEVAWNGVLPYARPGLWGAGILSLGRALGETMAVTMVIGNNPNVIKSLLGTGATLASVIANEFTEAVDEMHHAALAELGLVLLGVTLVLAIAARLLVRAVGRPMETNG
jgi:phosphate transport system permease protein